MGFLLLTGCASTHYAARRRDRAAVGAYLKGLMLERSAKLPDALQSYRLALDRDRRSAQLHVRIGATQLKLGEPEKALQSFHQALELEPNHPDALRWVAMLYTSQGKLDLAIDAYERLLKTQPDDPFLMSTLADLDVLQGRLSQAIDLYHALIREVGSTTQLHFNLGVLHGRLNQFDDAIGELSRAFELSPDSLDTRIALGLTYELSGRLEEAAAHYEDAIRLDALNPRLYHHLARVHLNANRFAEAAADYQAILDLMPRDLEAIMGLVRVWLAQSRYHDAEIFLAHQLEALGDPPELYVALGIVYREAQQREEALRAFERAIAHKPDYAQAHFYLAAQLDQLGRRHEAMATLRHTLQLDPHHSDAMNYLGYLDAEEGQDLPEARSLIEQALALDPDNGAYLDSLGWVYYKMGKLEEAARTLERAAERLDTDPTVFEHLGEVYLKRRDWQRARRNWERALELDATLTDIKEKLERLPKSQEVVHTP